MTTKNFRFKSLPKFIKKRRSQLNISQADLCRNIGMSPQQYSNIESGVAQMPDRFILPVSKELEIETQKLISRKINDIHKLTLWRVCGIK